MWTMWTSCQTLWIDKESFEILIGSLEDFERSTNRSNSSCCFTLSDTFENPNIDQQKSLSNIPILSNFHCLTIADFPLSTRFFCRVSADRRTWWNAARTALLRWRRPRWLQRLAIRSALETSNSRSPVGSLAMSPAAGIPWDFGAKEIGPLGTPLGNTFPGPEETWTSWMWWLRGSGNGGSATSYATCHNKVPQQSATTCWGMCCEVWWQVEDLKTNETYALKNLSKGYVVWTSFCRRQILRISKVSIGQFVMHLCSSVRKLKTCMLLRQCRFQ